MASTAAEQLPWSAATGTTGVFCSIVTASRAEDRAAAEVAEFAACAECIGQDPPGPCRLVQSGQTLPPTPTCLDFPVVPVDAMRSDGDTISRQRDAAHETHDDPSGSNGGRGNRSGACRRAGLRPGRQRSTRVAGQLTSRFLARRSQSLSRPRTPAARRPLRLLQPLLQADGRLGERRVSALVVQRERHAAARDDQSERHRAGRRWRSARRGGPVRRQLLGRRRRRPAGGLRLACGSTRAQHRHRRPVLRRRAAPATGSSAAPTATRFWPGRSSTSCWTRTTPCSSPFPASRRAASRASLTNDFFAHRGVLVRS